MKKAIVLIFMVELFLSPSFGQTSSLLQTDDVGKIVIGVNVLAEANNETYQLRELLEKRLTHLAAQAGFTSCGNYQFFISPKVVVESKDVAEGGMKNVYVLRGQLYLTIQDASAIYSSVAIPFHGSATSEDWALRNAITALQLNSFQPLFNEAKKKILDYYRGHKDAIFAKADSYVAEGRFDEAITCLMMIPEDITDLYQSAVDKAIDISEMKYQYEQQLAARELYKSNDAILVEANSLLAAHRPNAALQVLSAYQEGEPNQNATFHALLRKAESQVNAAERAQAEKERRDRQDRLRNEQRAYNLMLKNVELRKQRINAVKTIACEYLRNNPSFRYYIYY